MFSKYIDQLNENQVVEIQRFSKSWLIILLPLLSVITYLYPIRQALNDSFELSSLIPVVILLAVIMLFIFAALLTKVRKDGIYYKFFPLHTKWHFIKREDVAKILVSSFDPISEFGGWGIRYNAKRNKKALIIKGTTGLVIELKSGEIIVVGSQKSKDELCQCLVALGYYDKLPY